MCLSIFGLFQKLGWAHSSLSPSLSETIWEWASQMSGKLNMVSGNKQQNKSRFLGHFPLKASFTSVFQRIVVITKEKQMPCKWMWHEALPLRSLVAPKGCKSCEMATSDWSSTYTDGASLSSIPVSTGSPPDSGNSSPNSPAFAQDVSIFFQSVLLM